MRGVGMVRGAESGRMTDEKIPALLAKTRGKLETTSVP
ncbi:hypothetical protein C7S17_5791 [Burkholderia thailandensis]|nr:hypothetical protein [Burkholderia thailandensis]